MLEVSKNDLFLVNLLQFYIILNYTNTLALALILHMHYLKKIILDLILHTYQHVKNRTSK